MLCDDFPFSAVIIFGLAQCFRITAAVERAPWPMPGIVFKKPYAKIMKKMSGIP
jgi:hypothetical protein